MKAMTEEVKSHALTEPTTSSSWELRSSRLASEWREFRKRYLTIRRIIFWTIWIGVHTGLFVYGWYFFSLEAIHVRLRQKLDVRLATTNTIGYSVSMSRGAGLCIAFDSALILLPMLRTIITMIYPRFTVLNLDENIWFHRQVAYALLFFTIVHVTGFYVNFYQIEMLGLRKEDAYSMLYRSWAGTTGWIMCLVMFLIYTTAAKDIRIMSFETFRYTHFLYWIFFIGMRLTVSANIALLLHAAGCFVHTVVIDKINPAFANVEDESKKQCLGYNSWRYVIVGVALYAASQAYGMFRSFRKTTVTAINAHPERMIIHEGTDVGVVELQFVKPSFNYHSGQWLWINVPALSRFQWHPFTITSAPSDEYISIHIRCGGDWTDDLAKHFGITQAIEDSTTISTPMPIPENVKILVDGPFGAPAELVYKQRAVICVGSGIGITPWASVLKDIRSVNIRN